MRHLPLLLLVCGCLAFVSLACVGCGSPALEFDLNQFHIADDLTLRYWMPSPPRGSVRIDLAETPLYQKLEEVTGIHVVFEQPISPQAERQLEVLRQSDDLPDILEWNWLASYPEGPDAAIDDGLIRPLRDLIFQYAPNLFKEISEDEDVMRAVTSRSGRFYAFPSLHFDPETRIAGGLMVRRDWLEKLQREVPTTIDGWREMLQVMRQTNFDTPGRGREYPFFFPIFRTFAADETTYFFLEASNAFAGSWGVSHGMYRDQSDRIRYGPIQPGYRDMLVELNSWYEEELIHPRLAEPSGFGGFFDLLAKTGSTVGSFDYLSFLQPIKFVLAPQPTIPGISPLGPELSARYTGDRSAAIAATSTNAVAAAQWLDVAYSDWGKTLFNYGIEGESYDIEDRQPALLPTVVESYQSALRRGSEYASSLMQYSRILYGGPFELSGRLLQTLRSGYLSDGTAADATPWLIGAFETPDSVLLYDRGRSGEYARLMAPITRHARESFAAFITGQRPIDEFDTFVREIEDMKINEAISLVYSAEADFYTKSVF